MIISFPTPEERISRRVKKLISSAHASHRHQVTVSRVENESFMAWERIIDQFDGSDDIHVIYITHQDVLLNWRRPMTDMVS